MKAFNPCCKALHLDAHSCIHVHLTTYNKMGARKQLHSIRVYANGLRICGIAGTIKHNGTGFCRITVGIQDNGTRVCRRSAI